MFNVNSRYNRQPYPKGRPSNQLPDDFFDKATRERLTDLTTWMDGLAVVSGCERLLRKRKMRGDPGE